MTTYLTRPVFPFIVDREDALRGDIMFDDRFREIGFGPGFTEPVQAYEKRGFAFSTLLFNESEIQELETFLDDIRGLSGGFWVGTQMRDVLVKGTATTNALRIVAEALHETWNLTPRAHLEFRKPDGTRHYAQIDNVIDFGSEEEVQLTAALAEIPQDDWEVSLLFYVRRVSNDIELGLYADHKGSVGFRCVEIPFEYADPSSAQIAYPVFLYQFSQRLDFDIFIYNLTSYETQVVADAITYYPSPVDHGQISESTDGDSDEMILEMFSYSGNPFEDWLPINIGPPIGITIIESEMDPSTGLLTAKRDIIFKGMVESVTRQGMVMQVKCLDVQNIGGTQIPDEPITTLCPLKLYDPATCGAIRSEFQIDGTIMAIDNDVGTIDIESADLSGKAIDWMIGERIQTGTKPDIEIRTVEDEEIISATRHKLYLNWPLRLAQVSDSITGYAGCDRLPDTCNTKFGNFARYGGNIDMPEENLTLKAIPLKSSGGGKK